MGDGQLLVRGALRTTTNKVVHTRQICGSLLQRICACRRNMPIGSHRNPECCLCLRWSTMLSLFHVLLVVMLCFCTLVVLLLNCCCSGEAPLFYCCCTVLVLLLYCCCIVVVYCCAVIVAYLGSIMVIYSLFWLAKKKPSLFGASTRCACEFYVSAFLGSQYPLR